MKKRTQYLEYVITVRPGFKHDIEGILKEIKNQHKDFEFVIEKAKVQTKRSEYTIVLTPKNFKLLREKLNLLFVSGSISPIIWLILVRKNEENLTVAQIGLDEKNLNIYVSPEMLDILSTKEISYELEELNTLIKE